MTPMLLDSKQNLNVSLFKNIAKISKLATIGVFVMTPRTKAAHVAAGEPKWDLPAEKQVYRAVTMAHQQLPVHCLHF